MLKVTFYFLGALLTAVLLFACLAIISWGLRGMSNMAGVLVFWFICVPAIAYSSSRFIKRNNPLVNALVGILLFYGFMYFMLYKLTHTDFFTIVMYSFVTSVGLVVGYYYRRQVEDFLTSTPH